MTDILFIRRRRLGHGSTLGLVEELTNLGVEASIWRNDRPPPTEDADMIVRWGCTSSSPVSGPIFNKAAGIHTASDKRGFSQTLNDLEPDLQPECLYSGAMGRSMPEGIDWVVRPTTHAQGRNLYVTRDVLGTVQAQRNLSGGWYARRLINKSAEYRVYVMGGKVICVAQKTPGNPNDVAWNVAQGGRFDNVRWDQWDMNVMDVAVRAARHSGLDFTGVDVMVDMEGRAWFIEVNSAPSLPRNSDGTTTYRHKCVAKGLKYHLDNGFGPLTIDESQMGWRRYVHPALWLPQDQREIT